MKGRRAKSWRGGLNCLIVPHALLRVRDVWNGCYSFGWAAFRIGDQ
jgi:hypothetical protein